MASSTTFDEMTLLYSRFMRLIAILPFDRRGFASTTSRVLLVYCLVSSLFHWSMFVFYAVNGAGTPSIDTICETVLVAGVNARYYLLLPRRLEFAALLSECRSIWRTVDRVDRGAVRHFERKVRLLFVGLLFSGFFVNVLYSLSAVALNLEAASRANDTHPAKRYLPFKWYIDGGEDLWPGYKFNFALQVIVVANASVIATTVDSAAPLLIMLGAGYFSALQQRLYRLYDEAIMRSEETDCSRVDFELVACCRLHQRILRYCARINEIARTLYLVQLMCTGYNTSLIGIKLAGTDPDKYKYMPLVLLNLGQMFICQWAPDHLVDESEAISTAAYCVSFPWMRRRVGKLLMLMIARAQRPARMTAAGLVNLSLENFGSMLKGALSFFTILRNFNV